MSFRCCAAPLRPKPRSLLVGLAFTLALSSLLPRQTRAQAGDLNIISRVELKQGATVEIVGTKKPNFTTFSMSDPARLVIDISEARLTASAEEQTFKDSLVASIKSAEYVSEQSAIARIIITFAREVETDVKVVGESSLAVAALTAPAGAPPLDAPPPVPTEPAAGDEKKQRLAQEQQAAEEQKKRLAEEQQEAERQKQRLAEEQSKQLAEEKRAAEEQKQRLAEEKRAAEEQKQRLAEEKRAAEEQKQRLVEEEKARRLEEQKAVAEEKQRLAEEEKARRLEERRASEEQRRAAAEERQRLAEEQKARQLEEKQAAEEERRAAEEQKQRLAEELKARLLEEKQAAEEERRAAAEEKRRLAQKSPPPEHAPAAEPGTAQSGRVELVGFRQLDEISRVFIRTTPGLAFQVREDGPNLVLVELPGASIGKKGTRFLDTSFFDTAVALVSPRSTGSSVLVEIKLKSQVPYEARREDGDIVVNFHRAD